MKFNAPLISHEGLLELIRLKRRGKRMPDEWQESVKNYRKQKEKLWQIRVLGFNEELSEFKRTLRMCDELLEADP